MASKSTKSITLSLTKILAIRGEAFAAIKYHSATLVLIGDAIEQLDSALVANASGRGADQQHAVSAAASNLVSLLNVVYFFFNF